MIESGSKGTFVPPSRCWSVIGVSGDRTCPELSRVVHCRNCAVFGRGAEALLEGPVPEGYATGWTERIAQASPPAEAHTSVVLFRLGDEWLALDTGLVQEITPLRPVHTVAHRLHTLLEGIVNIRGQLELCVALDRLLEIPRTASPRPGRLLAMRREGEMWVFRAAEVHGVHAFRTSALATAPTTLAPPLAAITRGVFAWNDIRVGYLDGGRLVAALKRAIQ